MKGQTKRYDTGAPQIGILRYEWISLWKIASLLEYSFTLKNNELSLKNSEFLASYGVIFQSDIHSDQEMIGSKLT